MFCHCLHTGAAALSVRRDWHTMKLIARVFVCLALLNLFAFMIHDAVIGGSAGIGKVQDGKYYVGSHGHYTEVSRAAFRFSWWHEASAVGMFLITIPIVLDMTLSKRKWGLFD